MPLSRRAALALPVALFALSALTLILLRPATPVDETRYLAVAWEMVTRGEHLVPHLNGAVYGHKPPLLFWLMDAVWAVTGVSGFAARYGVDEVMLSPVAGAYDAEPKDSAAGRAQTLELVAGA